jgi:hypothetical protein
MCDLCEDLNYEGIAEDGTGASFQVTRPTDGQVQLNMTDSDYRALSVLVGMGGFFMSKNRERAVELLAKSIKTTDPFKLLTFYVMLVITAKHYVKMTTDDLAGQNVDQLLSSLFPPSDSGSSILPDHDGGPAGS